MQGSPNDQIAGPGPATRSVNAANALVSLPVITSKRYAKTHEEQMLQQKGMDSQDLVATWLTLTLHGIRVSLLEPCCTASQGNRSRRNHKQAYYFVV